MVTVARLESGICKDSRSETGLLAVVKLGRNVVNCDDACGCQNNASK